jgi:hypothetical protein
MSDVPDLEALARRYFDLWQDQMARMAEDPVTADVLSRAFTLMTRSMRAGREPRSGTDTGDGDDGDDNGHRQAGQTHDAGTDPSDAAPAGTAAASPLSGAGGMDLPLLLRRLDRLERRVTDLEDRLARDAGPAAGAGAAAGNGAGRPGRRHRDRG